MPVLRVIAGNIEKNVSSCALFNAQVQAREAAFEELSERAGKGLFGGMRLSLFRRLYYVLLEAGGMREHHKFMMVQLLWAIKERLKEIAAELATTRRLAVPDDIWFLKLEELLHIWDDGKTSWHEIIGKRREELSHYLKITPPVVITNDGETPVVRY